MATEQSTIDKITSWAGGKFGTLASPIGVGAPAPAAAPAPFGGTGLAPTVSGGGGVMNSNGTGTGYMFKSQANTGTPTGVAAPQGMLGAPAPAPAAPAATGMLGALAKPAVDYTSQLESMYKSTLKRNGDAAGMQWFSDKLASGATDLAGVQRALMDSDEYRKAGTIPTPTSLTARNINPLTETVQGQLKNVLDADSPVLQQARAEAQRAAADRGLLNSSIAASGGQDAVVRAATGIATTDAGVYGDAADYNTTAANQLYMYDRDQVNQFKKLEAQLGSEAAARAMQVDLAKMQDATSRWNTTTQTGAQWDIAKMNDATDRAQLGQQLTVAQMNDATSRYNTEVNTANSRYNTDTNYKQTVESNKKTLVNNILNNMDMSPDRKAALLESLGEGVGAKPGVPGTGLAGAVYVIDSVGADLNFQGAAHAAASQYVGG